MTSLPDTMTAVTIDRFGGPEVLTSGRRALPAMRPHEVLIEVAYAGVGSWDPIQREGLFVQITGETPEFPMTLGGDGSGRVAAIGAEVGGSIEIGDEVYGLGAGFYADYVAVDARAVSTLPTGLSLMQAGAMPVVALTALHGLTDELHVEAGESVLLSGASGDVGLVAVQLAKRLGTRVFAVASGDDGVRAVLDLGADAAGDGRAPDVEDRLRSFAPDGFDAVLALSGGPSVELAIRAARTGGRLAYPHGVEPEPEAHDGLSVRPFDLTTTEPAHAGRMMSRLNSLIEQGPFTVPVSTTHPFDRVADAHERLGSHRVGKIVLTSSGH